MSVWIAVGAGVMAVAFTLRVVLGERSPSSWTVPATLSLLFFLFSGAAIALEGPLGFWVDHTRDLWGNQIWMDLLCSASVAWWLILPRARAVNMTPLPWLAAVLGTGSIGLLAMVARLLWLEARLAR